MMGPGKYDEENAAMLKQLRASLIVMMVLDGDRGTGLSLSMDVSKMPPTAELGRDVARGLRAVADQIERDFSET
jgi:hypothetical protein